MSLPTRADYFNIGAQEMLQRSLQRPVGQRVSREAIFTEGTDANIILASSAAMADEVTRNLALRCGAHFLDGAEGEDLDRLVFDRYEMTRKPPGPAVVPLEVVRSNPAGGAVSLSIGTKLRTAQGTEFETTEVLTIGVGVTVPVSVAAQAVNDGVGGNVAAGTIVQFVQAPPDDSMTVSNPEPATGGAEEESDALLRGRARLFYKAARRGTLAAIEFGALTVSGVQRATPVEVLDADGSPVGVVQLYAADALGQANSLLATSIRSALLEYRAAGIVVDVVGATPRYEPIRYRLRFEAGVDTQAAFEEIRFLTVVAVNALAPGKPLPVSLLIEQARKVPGVIVLDDAIQAPVGDVIPAAGEIIKTRVDLVTAETA